MKTLMARIYTNFIKDRKIGVILYIYIFLVECIGGIEEE